MFCFSTYISLPTDRTFFLCVPLDVVLIYFSFSCLSLLSLCLLAVIKGGAVQCTVTSEPIGNMLLTQPRPLHSSICTAVLSLLTPSLSSPSLI